MFYNHDQAMYSLINEVEALLCSSFVTQFLPRKSVLEITIGSVYLAFTEMWLYSYTYTSTLPNMLATHFSKPKELSIINLEQAIGAIIISHAN